MPQRIEFFIQICIFACLFACVEASTVSAQLTILNTPTTDIVEKKKFYLEGDYLTNFKPFSRDGFRVYGYRGAYGLKRNVDVGFNFYYTRFNGGTVKEVQPTFKIKTYSSEKYQFEMATGGIVSIPLNRVTDARSFGLFYSNASKIINKTRGTRLTGGIYSIVGGSRSFGTRFGAIVGIEQPIAGKLSFLADWYSGKNQFGYSAAGLNYSITKRQFFSAGYNFSNTNGSSNAFSAYYGITF